MSLVLLVLLLVASASAAVTGPVPGNHTNNWVVLVDTSRFWFNYRHAGNVFSLYRIVRRLGVPDSHIILMVADGMACDAQNPFPGQLFNDEQRGQDVYGAAVEVDYRGAEVTAEALMRVLTGRHPAGTPPSRRLQSDADSHVLLYLTGHGGDEFFKFQDAGEISSFDLADAFESMRHKGRYRELLAIADTCQAATLQVRTRNCVCFVSFQLSACPGAAALVWGRHGGLLAPRREQLVQGRQRGPRNDHGRSLHRRHARLFRAPVSGGRTPGAGRPGAVAAGSAALL